MINDLFQLSASFIGSLAGLILNIVIGIYLIKLPDKNRDSKLFIAFVWLTGFYYCTASVHNLTVDHDLLDYSGWLHTLALCSTSVYNMWFSYEIGGNPFRREGRLVSMGFGLLVIVCFLLYSFDVILDDGTFVPPLAGYVWIMGVFRRKLILEKRRDGNTPKRKMFAGFQWWGLSCLLFWLVANLVISGFRVGIPLNIEWNYYLVQPLLFISTIYSAIVFLNYTRQRTSFQARLVGIILAALLMFLGLAPIMLTRMTEGLSQSQEFVQKMLLGFLILIPLTTLSVVLVLPMLLKHTILTPLNRVLYGVNQVNAGNLHTRLSVEVHDEVGLLTQQFNQMTDSLLRYNHEMDALVQERTLELQQSLATLRAAQSLLVEKEKMASLGELTAGVAHEIQNPLNFVNNFAEVSVELAQELATAVDENDTSLIKILSADLGQNMQHIAQSGQRASVIVRTMLEHSRAGIGTSRDQDINLNQLAEYYLRTSYEDFKIDNPTFRCEIVLDLAPSLPVISTVPEDLGIVFSNLFLNAFYAVKQKLKEEESDGLSEKIRATPTVFLATEVNHNQVNIRIKDNGSGIAKENLASIFQPFFTTKPAGQGTGLGLSLSFNIVTKRLAGQMQVTSAAGVYTEFLIILPVKYPESAGAALC